VSGSPSGAGDRGINIEHAKPGDDGVRDSAGGAATGVVSVGKFAGRINLQFVLGGLILALFALILGLLSLAVVSVNGQQNQNFAPRTQASSQKHGENQISFLQKTIDDPISLFTFLLVVVGGGQLVLFWWQLRIINRSVKDANISAIAALRSADTAERALTTLERPFVYCSITKPGIKTGVFNFADGSSRLDISRNDLEISVYNFGRTPARLTRIFWQISLCNHGGICVPINPVKEGGRELPVGTVCTTTELFVETENLRTWFAGDDHAIASNQKAVWVAGFVRYNDIFGKHHINGFALVFDTVSERFIRRGGPQYNYEREEQESEIPWPSSLN